MASQNYRRYVCLSAVADQTTHQKAEWDDEYEIIITDKSIYNITHCYEQKSHRPNSHMQTNEILQDKDVPEPVVKEFQTQLQACNVSIGGGGNRPSTPNVVDTRITIRIHENGSTYEYEKPRSNYVEVRKDGNGIDPKKVSNKVRKEAESILGSNYTYLHTLVNP